MVWFLAIPVLFAVTVSDLGISGSGISCSLWIKKEVIKIPLFNYSMTPSWGAARLLTKTNKHKSNTDPWQTLRSVRKIPLLIKLVVGLFFLEHLTFEFLVFFLILLALVGFVRLSLQVKCAAQIVTGFSLSSSSCDWKQSGFLFFRDITISEGRVERKEVAIPLATNVLRSSVYKLIKILLKEAPSQSVPPGRSYVIKKGFLCWEIMN